MSQLPPRKVILNDNVINLVLDVDEGPKAYIQSISFYGNTSFSSTSLKFQIFL